MADQQTSVTFKSATIKSATFRKGQVELAITAPFAEANATIGDLDDLTSGAFMGTVTIKGRQAQLPLMLPKDGGKE